ncbi:MAG: leucyl/phenylalanyl-tRNA--protein transferase [Bdellovibrionales bacterium]|nr:leucyl/phenylalanyl-tRNA--protein transferase [Bdellovibrionales bacterium]
MVVTHFPPTHLADEHGLLAVGGDVEVESLLLAYRQGIFPWPLQEGLLTWFAPPERAILEVERFMLSRSMKRFLKRHEYSLFINRDFERTILCCQQSANREGQRGTWITDTLVEGYIELFRAGYANSIECYEGEQLVGGLYGVSIGQMFAGESMFHRKDNTSKLCFCFLLEWLRRAEVPWVDCQVLTPLTESFGAHEVPRKEFEQLLSERLALQGDPLFSRETVEIGIWRGSRLPPL